MKDIDLSQHLPFRLAVLSNSIKRTTSDVFVSDSSLSSRDWRVLVIVGIENTLTATDIVRLTGLDKATISRACHSLEIQKLIKRVNHPEDGRSHMMTLTAKGTKIYKQLLPKMQASDQDYRSVLSAGEALILIELLNKLQNHANLQLEENN